MVFTFCWITKLNWGMWGLQNLIKHQGYFRNACSIPKSHSSIYKKSWNGSCLGMHYSVDTWGKRQSRLQTCFVSREKTWWGWSWPWGDSRVRITIWFKQLQTHTVGQTESCRRPLYAYNNHWGNRCKCVNALLYKPFASTGKHKWIHLCLPVVHLLCTCPQITTHGSNH